MTHAASSSAASERNVHSRPTSIALTLAVNFDLYDLDLQT